MTNSSNRVLDMEIIWHHINKFILLVKHKGT